MMLANEYGMSKRRVMAKAKVYGFSPWVDQVDAINQIAFTPDPYLSGTVRQRRREDFLHAP